MISGSSYRSVKCKLLFMVRLVKRYSLTNVNPDRKFKSWPFVGYEVEPPKSIFPSWDTRTMDTGFLGDEQRFRILGRGHSVPTVTDRIDFVLNHFVIKGFCTSWLKCKLLFMVRLVKRYSLTNVNPDRKLESCPFVGYEVEPPKSIFPSWDARTMDTGFSTHRPHIWETSNGSVS